MANLRCLRLAFACAKSKAGCLLGGLRQLGNIKKPLPWNTWKVGPKIQGRLPQKRFQDVITILQNILETFENTRTWPLKKQGLFWLCFFRQEQKGWAKNKTVAPAWSLSHSGTLQVFPGISWWWLLLGGVEPKLWAIYILKSLDSFLLLSQNLWWFIHFSDFIWNFFTS